MKGVTADQMQAYIRYLPTLLQVTAQQQPLLDLVNFGSAQNVSPMYAQLALNQLEQFGVPMAEAGTAVANAQHMGEAQNDLNVLNGPGRDLAAAASDISHQVDPEYYNTRAAAGSKLAELLGSINLNGLSGGERAEVERAINQRDMGTGNLGNTDSAINTTQNAMNFGSALQGKRDALGNALAQATAFLPAANSRFDPVQTALGRPSTNLGINQYQGNTQAGTQAFDMGQGYQNNLTSMSNNVASNRTQANMAGAANTTSMINAGMGMVGSACCFIFMEALNGPLPESVRIVRDEAYERYPSVRLGYKKMARWLVPLMARYRWVKSLVNTIMVTPLIKHSEYLRAYDGADEYRRYSKVRKFWFTVWSIHSHV